MPLRCLLPAFSSYTQHNGKARLEGSGAGGGGRQHARRLQGEALSTHLLSSLVEENLIWKNRREGRKEMYLFAANTSPHFGEGRA